MKNLKLFLCIAVSTIMFSCSNDDDGGSGNINGSLVGTWNATQINTAGTAETSVNGTPFSIPIAADVTNNNLTLTFEENPNNYSSTGSMDLDASISVVGVTYDQSINDFNPIGSGTYTVNSNQIVFSGNPTLETVTVEELTATTMILEFTNVVDTTQDGQDITATLNSTVKFTKQ